MKRYVREYAADRVKTFERLYKEYGDKAYSACVHTILSALSNCERGYITDVEAVRIITDPDKYSPIASAMED